MKKEESDNLMHQYFDGKILESNKEKLLEELKKNPQLKEEFILMSDLHKLMKELDVEEVSEGFTYKVMNNLDHKYSKSVFQKINRQGLLLLSGVVLVILVMGFFIKFEGSSLNYFSNLFSGDFQVMDKNINLSPLANLLDGSIIIKGILFLGLFIALMVFERTVLKNIFQKRNPTY